MHDASCDAVVVGAGPAGSAAALTLAKAGVSVMLLERGDYPGSKNMFGGTIYRKATEEIVPAFWQEAPLERAVITDEIWLMDENSAVRMGYTGLDFATEPFNKFTVLRSKFDSWLVQKAKEAGAVFRNRALVRELVYDQGLLGRKRFKGVKLENGEVIWADVTILAEGVTAFLAKAVGLRQELPPETLTLYVAEVMALPKEKIEERFGLEDGQGATIGMVGWPTAGAIGKAGIWTFKEHLILLVGGYLDQLIKKGLSPYHLLQRAKQHPLIRRLIEGAESVEYKAHMIPKGGWRFLPTLFADGLMVAGDAAVMISGRHGTDLAMLSGKHAAETAILAKAKGDFSEGMLRTYKMKLDQTFFVQDIKQGKDTLEYYKLHPDADYLLSKTMNEVARVYFSEDMASTREKRQNILHELSGVQPLLKTFRDAYDGLQHWGVF